MIFISKLCILFLFAITMNNKCLAVFKIKQINTVFTLFIIIYFVFSDRFYIDNSDANFSGSIFSAVLINFLLAVSIGNSVKANHFILIDKIKTSSFQHLLFFSIVIFSLRPSLFIYQSFFLQLSFSILIDLQQILYPLFVLSLPQFHQSFMFNLQIIFSQIYNMEDFTFPTQRNYTKIPSKGLYQQKKGFFRNFLKSEAKRFSSLVISNSISIEDNKIYFKIFMLSLQKPPSERTEQDDLATCKVLVEQNIFPQFHNDLNVLKIFARNIRIKQLQENQYLVTPSTKDDNLYKVVKGQVSFKKTKEGACQTKGKGQLIETYQQFKLIKDFEVQCKEDTYFLVINYKYYEQAMKIFLQNKIILKMLIKIQIFQTLERKQIAFLLSKCLDRISTCKQPFFKEGDLDNDILYFIVEGEVVISKLDENKKKQIVCYLSDGSLFGEQCIFLNKKKRQYSVAVHSSQVRVIEISRAKINEMLAKFDLNKQKFYGNSKYKEYLQRKNIHYVQKLHEASQVKQIYKSFVNIKKLSDPKQMQINSILKDVQNYAIKLQNKQKILEKRNVFSKDKQMISVEHPLFGKDDFPGYKHFMRRYDIYQAKAKENSCKLPHIN